MLEIDGAYREGGGQIVRTALALSACTGKPFRAVRIRAGRKVPGLKAQHVTGAAAIRQLCHAHITGDHVGSEVLECHPGPIAANFVQADIGTAGAITLLLQCLLLPLAMAPQPVTVQLGGGTDVAWAPPWDAFEHVVKPFAERLARFELMLERRGFHPRGGGLVKGIVHPPAQPRAAFDLTQRGDLLSIGGHSIAAQELEARSVADRQADAAEEILRRSGHRVRIVRSYFATRSAGSSITLWAKYSGGAVIGGDTLGERHLRAEEVGKRAAQRLLARLETGCCVDEHATDQLIPFLAVAGGSMHVERVSEHTWANIYVAEQFLDARFKVDGNVIKVASSQ